MNTVKVAMIGVGSISGIYLDNITTVFKEVEIIGVCDLIKDRALQAMEKYQIKKIYNTMHDAFADKEVDIILNLTRPYEHFEVTKAAIEAGKHVYSEKPIGASYEEGKELVNLAKKYNVMLGGAPDTFMGAGIQTCRKLIDDGFIGEPVGAAAFMICHGHETWHPDPEFYYKYGGGPMMDMGPYYITALINLLGGVSGVTAITKTSFKERIISSEPKRGEVIEVDVPTYITGIMNFDSGAIGTIFTTFDVYYDQQARLEIYGTKGTLCVPDPNQFTGTIRLLRPEDGEYKEMPLLFDYKDNSRGLGLADMAKSIQSGRDFRANHIQTLHVLEILESFNKSSKEGKYISLETTYKQNAPMINNKLHGIIED